MTTDVSEAVKDTSVLLERDGQTRAEDAIVAIHNDAARIKRRELHEAIHKLEACDDLTDDQRDAVAAMADAIVDRLLAVPVTSLVESDDRAAIDTALRLFDHDFGRHAETRPNGFATTETTDDD